MCFAYDAFNHKGSGRGRWYELRTGSPLEVTPLVSSMTVFGARGTEVGRGGILGAELADG